MDRQLEKKSWARRNRYFIVGGVIALGVLALLIINSIGGSKLIIEQDKIDIVDVKTGVFQDYIAVIGTVEPIQTVFIDVTEGGRVEEVYTDEGTMVNRGDPIIRLSNDNLLLEISNNEAQVIQAENEVKTLQVNLGNQQINNKTQLINLHYDIQQLKRAYGYNQELFKKELVSKEELDISRENYERNVKHYELLQLKSKQDSLFMLTRLVASEESVENDLVSDLFLVSAK